MTKRYFYLLNAKEVDKEEIVLEIITKFQYL